VAYGDSQLWAWVNEISAVDPTTGATVDLTHKLSERSSGMGDQTYGPRDPSKAPKKGQARYGEELPFSDTDLKDIVRVLREREALDRMGGP